MWYCNLCEVQHKYSCPTEIAIARSESYAEALHEAEIRGNQ